MDSAQYDALRSEAETAFAAMGPPSASEAKSAAGHRPVDIAFAGFWMGFLVGRRIDVADVF